MNWRKALQQDERGEAVSQILGWWDGVTSHSLIWKPLVRYVAKTLLDSEKSAYLQINEL